MSTTIDGAPLQVLVIVASTRPGRLGPAVPRWFTESVGPYAAENGITTEVADLAAVGLPLLDEPEHAASGDYAHAHTRAWSRQVQAADAFVVVTPEYNSGMPAALKNAIDFLYHEWAWKPVAFVSYGNTSAGTRAVQMTKQVLTALRMMPIGATVALRLTDDVRDEQVVGSPRLDRAARDVVQELARVARALRSLRPDADGVDGGDVDSCGAVEELRVTTAVGEDLPELLVLQRCCWVQEALANDTLRLAPLHETLTDLRAALSTWQVWCVRRHGRLIASVRARQQGTDWLIGRLMVAPDQAGHGLGTWLLAHAEQQAPEETTQCTLFTGRHSTRNIAVYQRAGYSLDDAAGTPEGSVHLTKARQPPQQEPAEAVAAVPGG